MIRVTKHKDEKNMKTMYLLCILPNKAQTIALEKNLIEKFSNDVKLVNKIQFNIFGQIVQGAGGEGITEGKNFIYVLFK